MAGATRVVRPHELHRLRTRRLGRAKSTRVPVGLAWGGAERRRKDLHDSPGTGVGATGKVQSGGSLATVGIPQPRVAGVAGGCVLIGS